MDEKQKKVLLFKEAGKEERKIIKISVLCSELCWCILELNVERKIYDKETKLNEAEHKNGYA